MGAFILSARRRRRKRESLFLLPSANSFPSPFPINLATTRAMVTRPPSPTNQPTAFVTVSLPPSFPWRFFLVCIFLLRTRGFFLSPRGSGPHSFFPSSFLFALVSPGGRFSLPVDGRHPIYCRPHPTFSLSFSFPPVSYRGSQRVSQSKN